MLWFTFFSIMFHLRIFVDFVQPKTQKWTIHGTVKVRIFRRFWWTHINLRIFLANITCMYKIVNGRITEFYFYLYFYPKRNQNLGWPLWYSNFLTNFLKTVLSVMVFQLLLTETKFISFLIQLNYGVVLTDVCEVSPVLMLL